ncbi:MAG: hypothetical protein IJV27_12400 [Prevotella sp.]|nr:hypothetical protein [Prevotella sp.]
MSKELRKVSFRLNYERGFEPDQTKEELKEQEEQERVRKGYFHEWASTTDNDENISFRVNKVGIVEEEGTGRVYCIFPDLITFNEAPYETA